LFVEEILVDEWQERVDVGKVDVKKNVLTPARGKDVDAYCV
jgi:hypothetical protein